jgi:hypothetical protein
MQEEEIGLRGAFALDASLLTGRTMLNLDTEESGQVYIGCAGCCLPLMYGNLQAAGVIVNGQMSHRTRQGLCACQVPWHCILCRRRGLGAAAARGAQQHCQWKSAAACWHQRAEGRTLR